MTAIKKNIVEAVNKQIRHEQSNAHIYQSVSVYFEGLNLHGFAAWMAQQAGDERMHAEKLIKHLIDRGATVEPGAIAAPPAPESPLAAVQSVLALEQTTTAMIHKLYELAVKENDLALQVLLHWFINEQVEEEQSAAELATSMELFHKSPGQTYMLDHHWGKRAKSA